MAERRVGLSQLPSDRLDSWKDIAAFFGRDVRTVRRWEAERGLPVRRVPGHARGRVFAYAADLKAWLDAAAADPDGPAATTPDGHAGGEADPASADHGLAASAAPNAPSSPGAEALAVARSSSDESTVADPPAGLDAPTDPPSSADVEFAQPKRVRRRRWASAAVVLLLCVGGALLVGSGRLFATSRHVAPAQAQELYLRGRYALSLRTEASLNDAVALFTQALERDPQYAAAYAGLADSHILLRQFGNVPDMEAFAKALAANERGLALEPNSVEALRTHAFLLNFWMWDFPAAEREFKRVIALDPLDVQTHHWYASSLYSAGRFRDALAEIDITRRLQPDSVAVLANHALLLASIDPHAALDELNQLEKTNAGVPMVHRYLGLVHFKLGQPRAAIDEMRRTADLHGDTDAVAVIDKASAALTRGSERDMLQIMGEGLGRMADRYAIDPLKPAYYYALLGNAERTLHFLTLAFDRHQADFVDSATNPLYVFLHGNAGFEELQRRRGAPLPTAAGSAAIGGLRPLQ